MIGVKHNGPHKASLTIKEEERLRHAIRAYVKENAGTRGLYQAMKSRFSIGLKLLKDVIDEETKPCP